MVAALLNEITIRKEYAPGETIQTIYFGGGTPSLLNIDELQQLLQAIHLHYPVADDAEITLEANPDDISQEKLLEWKNAGINRLSIGVQSFFEEDLAWMNRAHHAKQAEDCILAAQKAGFDNITIDLIYGTPLTTDEKWAFNVQKAVALGIPHLSCYALTVETQTPLHKMIREQKSADVDPDRQANQFLLLMDWMKAAGYEHYEISNFARPGYRSRHNTSYWQNSKYIGIGPSAHSFDGQSRQWNIANNSLYIKALQQHSIPFEKEILQGTQQLNEYLMTGLRTIEGIDVEEIRNRWGAAAIKNIMEDAKPYLESGKLQYVHPNLQLTNEGKLLADGIAAALFADY